MYISFVVVSVGTCPSTSLFVMYGLRLYIVVVQDFLPNIEHDVALLSVCKVIEIRASKLKKRTTRKDL